MRDSIARAFFVRWTELWPLSSCARVLFKPRSCDQARATIGINIDVSTSIASVLTSTPRLRGDECSSPRLESPSLLDAISRNNPPRRKRELTVK